MIFHSFRTGLVAALGAALLGCSDPPVPPEVQLALSQDQDLWRAGAVVYAPDEYRLYQSALQAGRDHLSAEKGRFAWLRDYEAVSASFREVIFLGEKVRAVAEKTRKSVTVDAAERLRRLERRVQVVRGLVAQIKDRRLSRRSLTAAEIRLEEARRLVAAERHGEARKKLTEGEADLARMTELIRPVLIRYADQVEISRWRQVASETVAESKRRGGYAIVVRKLDRELTLYHNGSPVRTYPAGMGFNYLADKLHAGDLATPEGKYNVVKKVPGSRFYRALLIDYPNEEDRRRFRQAKQARQIPPGAGIGSLIEIHGGGVEGMTNGCVSLENPQMEELYTKVPVGTPVAIIGTLDSKNMIVSAMPWLE